MKKNDLEKIGINHEEFLFVIWGGILKNQHRKKNTPIKKDTFNKYFIFYYVQLLLNSIEYFKIRNIL